MPPFALEAVLQYRKRQEDIAHYRYIDACRTHAAVSAKLDREMAVQEEVILERDNRQRDGLEIKHLLFYEERIVFLDKTIAAITRTLADKAQLVSREQQNLQQKNRERQIMEKLKQQQNSSWQNHLNKQERKMLDEIAVIRRGSDKR